LAGRVVALPGEDFEKGDGRRPAGMLAANDNNPANAGSNRHDPPFPQAAGEVKSMSRLAANRALRRSEFFY
jgi:hypothetical protein